MSPVTFRLSNDAAAAQQEFLRLYGGGQNQCATGMPRRLVRAASTTDHDVNVGKESKASLKRKRSAQIEGLPARCQEDTETLESVALESAVSRQGPKHEHVLKALKQTLQQKQKRLKQDIDGTVPQKKYEDAVAKHAKLKEDLESVLRCNSAAAYVAVPMMTANDVLVLHMSDTDITAVAAWGFQCKLWEGDLEQYKTLIQRDPSKLIWYLPDESQEADFVVPAQSSAVSDWLFAPRALGGWIASPSWLEHCRTRGAVVKPMLRLKPHLRHTMEHQVCNWSFM